VVDGDTVDFSGWVAGGSESKWTPKWQQLSGPSVDFSVTPFAYVRFVAPSVSTTTTLTFRFTIKKSSKEYSDDVTVVVEPTSASALCLQAPLYLTSYAWTHSACTTESADIAGDTRVATLYRQSEVEPNDSRLSANPLVFPNQVATEPLAADVEGSIHVAGGDSKDIFIFTPPSSGDYYVYLCNDPLACVRATRSENWYLELYDQDFNIVANTRPGILTEQKLMLWLEAGVPYYVGVFGGNDAIDYWQYNLTIIAR
jgi:hypothetical protein